MGGLDGRVAFITGAARGQGRSHAIRLAQAGADIVGVDLCAPVEGLPYALADEADLQETVAEVEKLDRRMLAVKADVRDGAALSAAATKAMATFGRLDIVVANAGILPVEAPDADPRAMRDALDVNVVGVQLTLDATVPHMVAGGRGGAVVLTSSLAALRVLGTGRGYAESKHALVGMARATAMRLAPHRIRVNTVHPTTVGTPMVLNPHSYSTFRPDLESPGLEDCLDPMTRLNLLEVPYVEPEDVAHAVAFLVSDEARYITGAALPVDAGAALR